MIRALAAIVIWGVPARSPGPAEATGGVLADRLAAIERCREGFADLGKTSPPSAAGLARACADIFREPACAAAMRDPPSDPAAFAGTITQACRDAYCPHLPKPRPKLCAARELPPPSELLFRWSELQQHIWAFELGVDPKVMAPLFKPIAIAVPHTLPSSPPAPLPRVNVYAKAEGGGHARVWIDGGKSVVVRDDGTDSIDALAREAHAKAPPDAQAIINVDKDLPYGFAVTLIDAFKRQGFTRFALSVAPSNAPDPR